MTYRAPVRDLALLLRVVGHDALVARAFPELDAGTQQAILEAAAAFAENELAPLNRMGDVVGARPQAGEVVSPPGFAAAYGAFARQGWTSLSAEPRFGGQGLPKALELAVFEMVQAANMAFGLCPMLSLGAIEALSLHGTPRQQALVLPKLVSGAWTGTMNLTEPQAGSDLAAVAARAAPDGRGGYRLTGQKIFITWGDHDLAENICHLVLARTPDAAPGVKGISLFLVTKRQVQDDGRLGARNAGVQAASLEHKLGIHGSPTCVMHYEDAQAELVGQLGQGLAHMFTMMNAARLHVGVQGVGIAERAFQQALAFSVDRRQGRPPWAADGEIFGHPDVRRTLVLLKARIDAARGICLMAGVSADEVRLAGTADARARSARRLGLLTPVAKGWSTELGVRAASEGLQIHGGVGFVEDTGAAQHYRDARIAPIYEGTNGIQAVDLVVRKVRSDNGAAVAELIADIEASAAPLEDSPGLHTVWTHLEDAVTALQSATAWVVAAPPPQALAAAGGYLRLAGDVVGGWILARQALAAEGADEAWLAAKRRLAEQFATQVLALAPSRAASLMDAATGLETLDSAALAS